MIQLGASNIEEGSETVTLDGATLERGVDFYPDGWTDKQVMDYARQNLIEFEGEIVRHPEVMECYTMTGIWDYMLKIVTRSIRHYEELVRNTLTASPSIRELHSHMAVTEIKNVSQLPLETQL